MWWSDASLGEGTMAESEACSPRRLHSISALGRLSSSFPIEPLVDSPSRRRCSASHSQQSSADPISTTDSSLAQPAPLLQPSAVPILRDIVHSPLGRMLIHVS